MIPARGETLSQPDKVRSWNGCTAGFVYSEAVASHYMRQVLEALRYCHENDIIHRDIKPHCVLLANKENSAPVKLGGFGVAIQLQDGQLYCSGGHRIGTPHYMAPEVIEDQKYGKPVDIWAAGVLLHVLLTGTLPFVGSRDRLFQSITKGKLHLDGPLWISITDNAKDLVRKMLSVDPNKRITIHEVINHKWLKVSIVQAFQHSAISMILESLDDIECLQEQLYEDKTMMNSLLEDKQLHILLELYDKISSKVISPNRTPPSDVVTRYHRCRSGVEGVFT
ncbi:peripheral plasma membrane protein CASK-like [Diaphorina citri]|uniref:Peripheral plasma membrane protein CASK-like n=1 Tax=Diaphorina citri TaxID=121845 RepID=A0A3Q0J492_DIACI|nr:peripheral plasma membrane protein CASK-like [Diaphorina citri]